MGLKDFFAKLFGQEQSKPMPAETKPMSEPSATAPEMTPEEPAHTDTMHAEGEHKQQ